MTVGGRPLDGATVRFVPERFLQGAVKPAVGTTDRQGAAIIAIADEDLPADQRTLRAMQPGIYRVEIKHPGVANLDRLLGFEVDPAMRGGTESVFNL